MATFTSVRAKLKSLIESTLEGVDNPLEEVFDYIETRPEKFPCAMIVPIPGSSLMKFDTCSNLLKMNFAIKVVLNDKNDKATEDLKIAIMDEFVDNLLNLSTVTDTLDGEVDIFQVTNIAPFSEQTEHPIVGIDFLIEATTIKVTT